MCYEATSVVFKRECQLSPSNPGPVSRLIWFVGLWIAGVLSLALVAGLIRLFIKR